MGSHGSSLLLFMMKGIVCHFVTNSHKVTTALVFMLPLKLLLWTFLCNFKDIFTTRHYTQAPFLLLVLGVGAHIASRITMVIPVTNIKESIT